MLGGLHNSHVLLNRIRSPLTIYSQFKAQILHFFRQIWAKPGQIILPPLDWNGIDSLAHRGKLVFSSFEMGWSGHLCNFHHFSVVVVVGPSWSLQGAVSLKELIIASVGNENIFPHVWTCGWHFVLIPICLTFIFPSFEVVPIILTCTHLSSDIFCHILFLLILLGCREIYEGFSLFTMCYF